MTNDNMKLAAKFARRAQAAKMVVEILVTLLYILVRGTLFWLATLLIGLPSLGLPAITWFQALGIVIAVRAMFSALTASVVQHVQKPEVNDLEAISRTLGALSDAFPQQQSIGSEEGR